VTEPEGSPALVVGAGPVGLTCALALRANGVDVTVLEADTDGEARPGSRAIYVHRASLELLERIKDGLGREIGRDGVVWPAKRTLWRGREVFARTYAPARSDRLPPFASLPQTVIERHLVRACEAARVEVRRGAEVEAVAVGSRDVTAVTRSGAAFRARYLVGADGARSAVRRALSIAMEGPRSENAFVVVDVAEDPERPTPPARVFHYGHPGVGGRNVLLVPFAGGWRADLQCLRRDEPGLFDSADGASRWIASVLGDRYAEKIAWVSTYRFQQAVASTFVDASGRALLIGDAAHLFAPFGARGMNSGIADAVAAASAIADALAQGDDGARAAISRFATERRAAALQNRRAAAAALTVMQSRRPGITVKRRIAAALAPRVGRAGAWLDSAPYGPRLRAERRSGY
jgi:3-(3-hydroxy-phenyl)propionate hydroxylase